MTRHRMSAVDTAWLHMDRPLNRMIVHSVMWFDEPMHHDALRALLEQRLIPRFSRFSQRVVELPGIVWWEDVEDFDIDDHLYDVRLPAPGGKAELEMFVSGLVHGMLPLDRPLWEIHLVTGFGGNGSALVVRIHHCIADGIALSRVLMALADDADVLAPEVSRSRAEGPVSTLARHAADVAHDVVHPSRIVDTARVLASHTHAVAQLVGLPPDRASALRGRVGLHKNTRWSDPLTLADVHAAAREMGSTVNDLVLCAISGALRDYLADHDGVAHDVRAIVPINLRDPREPLPKDLGNRFGLGFLELPVSSDDPVERLATVSRRTRAMKQSVEGAASYELLAAVGVTPYGVEQSLIDLFSGKGSLIVTNVAGPTQQVLLAGCRMIGNIGWPPESGNVALGMSVTSYAGQLTIGVLADAELFGEPDLFLARVLEELDLLMTQAVTTGRR